jgi:radical SAM superfamily enzyme
MKLIKEPIKEYKMEEERKIKSWEKCIKREFQDKGYKITLGQMIGGCPNCGHLCSFDKEKFHCYKCKWDWKNEQIEIL